MLRSILDVALQRIRSSNSQFSNAVLTRAHIRIVSGGSQHSSNSQNSALSLRRLLPDYASLYNNSPSGIFQDLIEDMLEPNAA